MKTTFILLLALAAVGCDLLSTRDPQQPSQQSNYRTPTSPDIVLGNLENAINGRDAPSYARCFADSTRGTASYRFTPAADAQLYAGLFQTWGVKEESAYFVHLVSQVPGDATLSVFLDSLQTEANASDSTIFAVNYVLIANHTVPSLPTQARGRMHLTIKPDPLTQLWAITQWVDVVTTRDPSWSIIKARF